MKLMRIADELTSELAPMRFKSPVCYVYRPLVYARAGHSAYVRRYGQGTRDVVLLGMNPGPWGMVQTGVPFGTVSVVRDWLGISTRIAKPDSEHPKRPVLGFDCPREEVSGQRIWGWARDAFHTPDRFFKRFFVANYCPLAFLEETGRNRTPDKLSVKEKARLFEACDRALRRTVETLKPRYVIGVGAFAEARASAALDGIDVEIGRILHPSPASPTANRGWAEQAKAQLAACGIDVPN